MKIKSYLTLLILIFLGACGENNVEKPDNLIPQKTMEEILYDLAIIDAARISNPQSIVDAGISQQGYIFEKYKVDSLQFAQSNAYYTADVENYIQMYKGILEKIETEKTVVDSIVRVNRAIADSLKLEKIKQDSIAKTVKSSSPFKKKIKKGLAQELKK
uniref:DUF4296 domain-containing protein n=1 Tax=Flavobacterium sp. TaxID=239 RepID=UPI0040491F86